jgi:phosphoserine aminotransferase
VSDLPAIPTDLLPADGRFGCGPSKVPLRAVELLATDGAALLGTSHRQAPVKDLVARLRRGLATLFDVPDGHEVLVANGGATAFWDMATFGLVERRSQHAVFGEFSGKFAAATAAAPWLDAPVIVEAPVGGRPDPALLAARDGVDAVALTHNETSTGVMQDVVRPDGDALVLVDATSGAGGLPVDVAETDVYYFSLQKGFAAEGGLVVAIASPAALERIERIGASDRYVPAFLDLPTVVANSRKEQTYNTPAVSTLLLGVVQVETMLEKGGLDVAVDGCRAKADHLYSWAEDRDWASPFVDDPAARSYVVGTIDLDDAIDHSEVTAILRANGVVDTEPYRKLGRNQLRVGMFPAVDLADVEAYTACVDWIVDQL